uniref:OSJNBb0013J13.4 protein n=1 Tax=Oryza sativa subsp. japonica TaxID=39947 RepID=Q7XP16_ORYSJ|nr:OSJNBb0013J13.4 [Oryza sativa Japonica Group]
MTWLQDMLRQMQEQQQAYEATRRTKATSAPILQYSAGYAPPQVRPQVVTQPSPPLAAQPPVYFAGQHQPPGQATKTVAEGASALQAQLQAHYISSTTPSAHPVGNTSQGAPNWLPPIQQGSGPSPWSQGQQFDFGNTAQVPTVRQQVPTPGFGTNQAPIQAAMTWSQPIFDPSMAAQQVPPVGAGQPNAMAQLHAQAAISPFATPYPQQGAVKRAGGEKGLPLSGGIKTRPIPPQFKFPPVPRYSGETDPKEFLSIYESAIEAAHGDENTKAKPIAFTHGSNCAMFFVLNFRGTYEEPKTQQHLLGICQRPGELIREYMRRFSQARCQVQDITEASVINAASAGLLEGELTRKITNKEPQTLEHLLCIIDGFARGEKDSKRRQAIQAEYDKASVATAQAQAQVQIAEPPPLSVRQSQPAIQGQPPRQGQARMTWRKFRTDWAGKAVMAVEENAIFGRATLNKFEAISHHNYLKLKIPGPTGVIVVKGLQPAAASKRDLAVINRAVHNVETEPHERPKHTPKPTPHGKVTKVQIDDADSTKLVSLGGDMGEEEVESILEVLKKNIDIFAWSPDEIYMNPLDIPKTSFITSFGTFCHLRMPFGLRNAGATFTRLVYKVLGKQLGQNVEAYVDDIVVKSRKAFDHAIDLQETFDSLRAAGIKLNPEKCVFGVRAGKLLGFLVSERGIEANPEKIDAIQQMKPPSSTQSIPLKGGRKSAALVQETESGQKPVYFVSEALQGAKTRYIEMEKLAYALVMASRKLKHYFQAHKVIVPSQYPLGGILRGKKVTGRLSKWAVELSPFDLHFVARSAIKSQVLADFVAEWTPVLAPNPEPEDQFWVMCSDGSWSHKGAGVAAVLFWPNGVPIRYTAKLQFDTTNNAAEYKAVLLGLRKAKALGVRRLLIRTDSKLVAGHVDKSFEAKEEGMNRYLEAVRSTEKCFTGITVEHLPRDQNEEADALAKSAACGGPHLPGIFFEVLHAPSVPVDSPEVMAIDQEKLGEYPYDWRTPFVKHLETGWLPVDEAEAKRLQLRATKYKMVSAVEYFSRWIEAEPLGAITSAAVQKFVWKNIVCRFGMPKEFITDNGKQFDSDKFREMCEGLNLEIRFASIAHPQSNGAAERTNGKILEALKKRLEGGGAKGKWPEELLSVLWALRTTPTRPTKFSPFMLLYGDEAMTPTELGANSPMVMFSGGEAGREVSLELLEGVRVEALEHMRKYATSTSATYNKKVRPRELMLGQLVLRKKANPVAVGKLESKWEGPYLIKRKSRTGSFRLATLEGEEFDHSWNAACLKRFYV